MRRIHIHIHRPGQRTVDMDFREADHPRAANGEFAPTAETTKAVAKAAASSKKAVVPKWTKHDGTDFTPEEHARLKALKVRPDLTRIKLADDPTAKLQVTGLDSKGRTQRIYSAEHSEKAAAEKFARLKAFNSAAGGIMTSAQHDMANTRLPQRQRDAAAVIKLIARTGFRIGSEKDTGADSKAYGASTLTKEHIKLGKDGNISFNFGAKSGVTITKELQDHELHRYLKERMKTASAGEKVFDVPAPLVRKYLKAAGGAEFKVKDFRTWNGTNEALKKIAELPEPTDPKSFAAFRLAVAKHVSAHLGNTPKVALDAYIDPAVFGKWSHLQ
jgi:DNA topoisomerase-1